MYEKNKSTAHYSPAHGRSRTKRQLFLTAALIAVMCIVISAVTLAYIFTNTGEVKNIFTPSEVGGDVVENFDGEVKKDVCVKNTGDVESYIRAGVIVTWMNEAGTEVAPTLPVEGTDYTIEYADATTSWVKADDGFWYYTKPVAPGVTTDYLIKECKLIEGVTPPDGYYLSVEIIASSIQSTPATVVTEQWNSGVSDVNVDGSLTIIKTVAAE